MRRRELTGWGHIKFHPVGLFRVAPTTHYFLTSREIRRKIRKDYIAPRTVLLQSSEAIQSSLTR